LVAWRKGLLKATPAKAPQVAEEKRIDPADGCAYTLNEIVAFYSTKEGKKYIDRCIHQSQKTKAIKGKVGNHTNYYWDTFCKTIVIDDSIHHKEAPAVISTAIAGATEKHLREVALMQISQSQVAGSSQEDLEEIANSDRCVPCDISCGAQTPEEAGTSFRETGQSPSMYPSTYIPGPFWLHEYARSPKQFEHAINHSSHLEEMRNALAAHGLSLQTKDKVTILVRPEDYATIADTIRDWHLGKRYVVVAEEFEGALRHALEVVGKGVTVKDRKLLPPATVRRTFISVATPTSLRSCPFSTGVASTTDANPRARFKPRQA
jgi:hypothetical protein